MKLTALLILLFPALLYAQKEEKYITTENVTRIINTLAADNMGGRPARNPQVMEKATAFIEQEFKKAGLKPFPGLKTFRQSFHEYEIEPQTTSVIIDGKAIADAHVVVYSFQKQVTLATGNKVQYLEFDSAFKQNRQLIRKAFALTRDTSNALVLVDPKFESQFAELKRTWGKRLAGKARHTKVFVLAPREAKEFTATVVQQQSPIVMNNVVGIIEGTTRKDEFVVFSGHYDHLGVRPTVNGDSIANGADDDASGTTAVISLAKYFKKTKQNTRTLVFVAFTAEEIGGFGSQYFSKQLNPDKVVAMFNIEMIGKPSKWGQKSAFITGFEMSDFGQILQKNLGTSGFEFKPDPYPEQNLFYRSDNATLARLGVPAHTISTDQIDTDPFYHTVDDEVETLDMTNITGTIRAIALSAKSIVAGTDTPSRVNKASVR